MQTIAWDKIYRQKWKGELDTRKTKDISAAFLAKQVWKILTQLENILVQLVKAKYSTNFLQINKTSTVSNA